MQRIVIDTNVLVSALLTKGYSSQIVYELILSKKVAVCLSPSVFQEYVNVLFREKFAKYPSFVASAEIVLAKLEELAVVYEPEVKIDRLKDKDDNKFLELAVAADATYLVTGDKRDFRISVFQAVQIVSPKEYWEIFTSTGSPPSFFSEPRARYRRVKVK